MPSAGFQGFHPNTLKFLSQLKKNNNRDWFNKNKSRYETDFVEPSLAYIEAMQKPLASISPLLTAVAKKSGGSLMRIYRDTRFSKDKTPYKTNIGISLRHQAGSDVHAPGFYVHIEPKSVFFGAGMWHPESAPLKKVRQSIADDPAAWMRVRDGKAFRTRYKLAGDSLKRPPTGFDAEHSMIDDIKRKDFIGVCELDPDAIFSKDFVRETITAFKAAKPFVRFLCQAINVPF